MKKALEYATAKFEEAAKKAAVIDAKYQKLKIFHDAEMTKAAQHAVSLSPVPSPKRAASHAPMGSRETSTSPSSNVASEASRKLLVVDQADKKASWLVWEGFAMGTLFAIMLFALLFVKFLQTPRILPRIG
uniref:Uncharacterized protein n=2 Tax=Hemiselmis andersenii TaxID=464988 RepID=A0A6T8JCV5_HEMAN